MAEKRLDRKGKRLSRYEVLYIRELHEHGHRQGDIADAFGVSPQTISEVVNFKRYPNVKPGGRDIPGETPRSRMVAQRGLPKLRHSFQQGPAYRDEP